MCRVCGDCGPQHGWDLDLGSIDLSNVYDWRSCFLQTSNTVVGGGCGVLVKVLRDFGVCHFWSRCVPAKFAVVFVSADVILEVGSRSVAVTFSETRVPTLVLGWHVFWTWNVGLPDLIIWAWGRLWFCFRFARWFKLSELGLLYVLVFGLCPSNKYRWKKKKKIVC